jgi:ABC-2 type transport system ATP-binding protein
LNHAIRTERLRKKFRRIEAVRNLDLVVPEGAIYAMVGPNGAGKTTLIKMLMNIFPATSGHAEVLGVGSSQIRGKFFASIGYVSENQRMPGWMRVRSFFSYLRPFYPGWDRKLENELIAQFGLPLEQKLRHLSRGTRMKAALAGALAFHPRLIVLDEPFTGLDPLVRDELIQALLESAEEATVFISSHDLAEIETFASDIGYLEQGQLRISEELSKLSERFREVELTFDAAPPLPRETPVSWMHISNSAAVVRFIESRFDPQRTAGEIRSVFGEARNVEIAAMPLRSIFIALAKAGRAPAEPR